MSDKERFEEVPDELKFQRHVNDWSLSSGSPEGARRHRRFNGLGLSADTFHSLTTDKTLDKQLYDEIYPVGDLLK